MAQYTLNGLAIDLDVLRDFGVCCGIVGVCRAYVLGVRGRLHLTCCRPPVVVGRRGGNRADGVREDLQAGLARIEGCCRCGGYL